MIKAKASEAGLTIAEYLRNLGLGYTVSSVIDNRQVDALLKINADLGRLGGLIKLWLYQWRAHKIYRQITVTYDAGHNPGNTKRDAQWKPWNSGNDIRITKLFAA